MKKGTKRLLAVFFAFAMILTTVGPTMEVAAATAVTDSIEINDPIYDSVNGTMSYARADGYGTGLYKSIVITFTSVRQNNENAVLPTSYAGFNYETSLSTESTYVVNMPDGKTLPEIATYIRRIKFYNCLNSSQKINFSIGKQEVKYITFYCEATGHYYQFYPYSSYSTYLDWYSAYTKASTMTYEGLQGYLATVTSEDEDLFLFKAADAVGWIGGTSIGKGSTLKDANGNDTMYMSFSKSSINSGWYWACGPEMGQTFYSSTGGHSTSDYTSNYNAGYYFNWDSGSQPDGSSTEASGEHFLTVLNFGNGYATNSTTVSANGKYTSSAIGSDTYGWNDLSYNYNNLNQASTERSYKYTPKGFFVEFGDATTGLKTGTKMTNYEFKTTTKAITHTWEYVAETSTNANAKDTIVSYCTLENPKCTYYGSASYHSTAISATLSTPDMAKNGSAYNLATFTGGTTLADSTGGTLSSIKYYKSTVNGATSGGTALTAAPSTPGYYYAEVSITNSSTNNNTATAVSPFTIYDPSADYAVESINNKGSDANGNYTVTSGTSTVSYKKVTGATDAKTDLEVVLSTAGDNLTLYKLADYTWTDGVLSEPAWVDTVQKWVDASSTYKTTAATPTKLSNNGSSSTYASFYKDLLKSNTNVIENVPTGASAVLSPAIMKADGVTDYSYEGTTNTYHDAAGNAVESTASGASRYSQTYTNIKPGIYAVMAKNGSHTYAVTVAAITPQRTGPKSTYTLQTLYTVYIKQSEATLSKYINDMKEDAVGVDETVTFRIDFELPSYADRAKTDTTAATLTKSPYTLALTDTMSSAYTINEGSIKLYYKHKDKEGNEIKSLFYQTDSAATTNNTIPTQDNYIFYKSQVSGSVAVTSSNYASYNTTSDMANTYALKRTATPIFDAVTVVKDKTSNSSSSQTDTTIKINFDEPALRAWAKDSTQLTADNADDSISGYVLEYTAVVDKDAKVNSKDNYNKAALTVEDNSDGSKTKDIEDVVYGYTYGLKIVKIDGDSYGTDSQKYIAGAKFKLYKEVAAYSSSTSGSTTNYTFLGDTAKTTASGTDPLIKALGVDTTTYTDTQAQENQVIAKAKANSSYYVYEQSNIALTGDGLVNDTIASFDKTDTTKHVALSTGMNLTRIYQQVIISNGDMDSKGIITSVNTADGVTCHGLAEGTYILVESQAPIGYNELSEDMYFEIDQLTSAEEQGTSIGTLQQFREDLAEKTAYATYVADTTYKTATYSTDALITLDVLNYAGLTLPSTGGIGILIFVIIGVAIMATVIVVIIKRRQTIEEGF